MSFELGVYDPDKTYFEQKKFDCEHAVISKFVSGSLKQQVKKNTSVAYVLTDPAANDRFIGFFTLVMSCIDNAALAPFASSLPRQVPCVRLVMLGVDKAYKGKNLGLRLLKHALTKTKESARTLGCRGLYLDADPGAVAFYTKYGFIALEKPVRDGDSTPMFLFLESFF
ncbi:MAG: GNAT family N-acetyltransferase [Polaromonas sp.]